MVKSRTRVSRYVYRGDQQIFGLSELTEGMMQPDGTFKPIYNNEIFFDEECIYYRQSYVERQLVISPSVMRSLVQAEEISGFFKEGEFRINRNSLLDYLDRNHFMSRTLPEQPPAAIGSEGKINENVTQHNFRHQYLPTLWGIEPIAEYVSQKTDIQIEKVSIQRHFHRMTEDGVTSFYRISGLIRFSREDFMEFLRNLAKTDEKFPEKLQGRPIRMMFSLLGPFIVAVMRKEGIDSKHFETYYETLKWRAALNRRKREGASTNSMEEFLKQAEKDFDYSPLYYLQSEEPSVKTKILEIEKELYPV